MAPLTHGSCAVSFQQPATSQLEENKMVSYPGQEGLHHVCAAVCIWTRAPGSLQEYWRAFNTIYCGQQTLHQFAKALSSPASSESGLLCRL
mmetsp:Transcript_18736/g.43110  ORF Transcript_18736/g.43110 Transcript_18736/m.43110 type:complete len:91 (+) Transcript_18736:906-1178(+)